jgi:hypothetical protein
MTDPGRMMRSQPQGALKPHDRIGYSAMSMPVSPSPAWQCTEKAPGAASTMRRKAATTALGGQVQSGNSRLCEAPRRVRASAGYRGSLNQNSHAHAAEDLSVEGGAKGPRAPRVVVVVAIVERGDWAFERDKPARHHLDIPVL